MVVAIAAPPTPVRRGPTKSQSSKMFTPARIATARKGESASLAPMHAACATMQRRVGAVPSPRIRT
eukprot:755433-Hanusia_phi.AAC.2